MIPTALKRLAGLLATLALVGGRAARPLDLPVRHAGGTLVLEGRGFLQEVPKREFGLPWQITPATMLRHWADLQDTPQAPDRLVVPNVEPGRYTLCPGSPFILHRGEPKEGEAGCASGFLKAAGELVLRLGSV